MNKKLPPTIMKVALTPLLLMSAKAEEIVPVDRLMGEENYRVFIHEREKNLETLFYYFDGKQTFAAFEDKQKAEENILLIIVPDSTPASIHYSVNGKPQPFKPTPFTIKVSRIDRDTGNLSRELAYDIDLGVWMTAHSKDAIELRIIMARNPDRWRLVAKKPASGQWQGLMAKIEDEDQTEQAEDGDAGNPPE